MAGKDLWRSASPAFLPRQTRLEQVTQGHIQVAFEYLQQVKLHDLSGQPVPVLCYPQCKKFFLTLCFSLWPLLLILLLSTTERSLVSSAGHPPLKYLYVPTRSPFSLLFSGLRRLSFHGLSP